MYKNHYNPFTVGT